MQALAQRLGSSPRLPWPDQPVALTFVITDLDVGGAEGALVALAKGIDRNRWQPSVVCLDKPGYLTDVLCMSRIETICLDVNRRKPVQAVRRLAKALKQLKPALVQSFLFHANIATRLAAPLSGRPWVVGGIRVAERHRHWHLWLDQATSHLGSGSVCVSEGVRRFMEGTARINPDRLTVIPNSIDPRRFDQGVAADRMALGIPLNAPLILFIGRLDPQKGIPILLEAANKLAIYQTNFHLVLVGDGPDERALLAQADSYPALTDRLHWLSRRNDIKALLKASDLFVLPSLWEGMPNVVLEAMAARRAVVATRVEGTEDLVVPGETGWLVPPGDAQALSEALSEALSDRDRLHRFGRAGRIRVETHFEPEQVIKAYEKLWANVLGYEYS